MSGKPRRPSDSPDELRELTRALHEAAKDARAAERELAARQAQVVEDLATGFEATANHFARQLQEHLDRNVEELAVQFKDVREQVQRTFSDFMGARSPGELTDLIIEQTVKMVRAELASIRGEAMAQVLSKPGRT